MPRQTAPVGKGRQGKGNAQARERARLARIEQLKRERRNRLLIRVGIPIVVVIAAIAALVIVKANQSDDTPAAAGGSTVAAAAVTQAVAGVSAATFDAVGVGTVKAAPTAITGTPLTADGKPRVLYIGAEYCPYCAAERWAMVTALSRFGTFSGLGETTSASADVYPSTATLSFHGATYSSDVLSFTGVETTTNERTATGYAVLDTPTDADQALITQYNPKGSIPFIDMGNKYMVIGSSYDPSVLQGLTQQQIAESLADASSPVAQAIDGSANVITAALCTLTDNKPAAVCSSAGVTAGAAKLPQ